MDPEIDFSIPYDIFAIGFEEMVDLNASNIVNTRSGTLLNQKTTWHSTSHTLYSRTIALIQNKLKI